MLIVLKSGSLSLLEPSGPVQVSNGIALLVVCTLSAPSDVMQASRLAYSFLICIVDQPREDEIHIWQLPTLDGAGSIQTCISSVFIHIGKPLQFYTVLLICFLMLHSVTTCNW